MVTPTAKETHLHAGQPFVPIIAFRLGCAAVMLALTLAAPVCAQSAPTLPGQATAAPALPADGTYLAGDSQHFFLDRYNSYGRLRFADTDEVFYLAIEPSALGGRALKYDTGDVALNVSGWGGVTLYTREVPGGLPAERTGDAVPYQAPPLVSGDQIKNFALQISSAIQSHTGLVIGFRADWDDLARSDLARTLACDAMRNAERAIEHRANSHHAGEALIQQFNVVRITPANEPAASVGDKLLTVAIAPARGFAGRPSSLFIIKAIKLQN